ncbi:hypothetical protein KR50_35280 [Jeotgalibacillus campisalis]|uniref:Uncharacterized protein n=1 Tax=Jeotgalibacillus campisalis TaxID=220754 RepID=A0A0C2QYL7_9BACL|nr:hypothetical protein KR50_35280 [Jeotgalibacillus campisalis]
MFLQNSFLWALLAKDKKCLNSAFEFSPFLFLLFEHSFYFFLK